MIRPLGEGGMGVVYAAHDDTLQRPVAIKMIRQGRMDEAARKRLWREARAAAAVNHPNICQIYEAGEDSGDLYLVMELLEGETLAGRLARGPAKPDEAVPIALGILAGLEALHARGLVHRDLKPSNVFLAPHGVKLLDFGLTRSAAAAGDAATETAVTIAGAIAGTPQYMAPEQIRGETGGPQSDLFAAGAILHEMLTGRRVFSGTTVIEVLHAVAYEEPSTLTGSTAISGLDRICRRAMAKTPSARYPDAVEMAGDLRSLQPGPAAFAEARAVTRFLALPFRMLRPDEETGFLAFSLPDAISTSLSVVDSLQVRSSAIAGDSSDLKQIAAAVGVDVVLTGTILRAGAQIRVATQLVEAATGTLLASQAAQAPVGDLFHLQDDMVERIVAALRVPLTAREHQMLKRDVPANPRAYEFYLRANELARRRAGLAEARDLYRQCLALDSAYAPAWARLGRCLRVIAKYYEGQASLMTEAEGAFRRSLELNPELPAAHSLYAQHRTDLGQAAAASVDLITRLRGTPHAAELYAGLVYSLRFCGLLDEAVLAHHCARRLDPNVVTSVGQCYFWLGHYQAAIDESEGDFFIRAICLYAQSKDRQALEYLDRWEAAEARSGTLLVLFASGLRRIMAGDSLGGIQALRLADSRFYVGPEERYFWSRGLAKAGDLAPALAALRKSVEDGFFCYPAIARDPWLAPLSGDAGVQRDFGAGL